MGFRAYVNKKRIIEYGKGCFNHCFQEFGNFLYELKNEMETDYNYVPFCIDDEMRNLQCNWEIEKKWIIDAIEYIKENKNLEEEKLNGYTYGDIVKNFEYWLEQSKNEENFNYPDYVYISWF